MISKDRIHPMIFSGKTSVPLIAGVVMLLFGCLLCSCNKRPKGVLSDKKMVEVMTDLQLAESYSYNNTHGYTGSKEREELSLSVLESHKVTKEQLDTTLGWYGRNLDEYAKLYDKVDKRLNEKRASLIKEDGEPLNKKEGDNLWRFGNNGMISSLGNSDGWRLSIVNPELSKGDLLEWSMHVNKTNAPLVGVLGVEYEDGTSEALTTVFNNRQNIDFSFQTDTSKIVNRIFGSVRIKDLDALPLFADSIMLRKLPYDSLEYVKYRPQRKYGVPVRTDKKNEEDVNSSESELSQGDKDEIKGEKALENIERNDREAGVKKAKASSTGISVSTETKISADTSKIVRGRRINSPASRLKPPKPDKLKNIKEN